MKLLKCISICLLLITVKISAQSYNLSAVVKDEHQLPISYASVAIYNSDKSIENGIMTLDDGTFSLENLQKGKYTLTVSFLGYETHQQEIELEKSIQLPEIILKEDAVMLETIVVMGYKKLITNNKGKTTLRVEGSMLTAMPSSTMVMSFVPGVKVINDNVEVIGKGTPLIFINGREVKNPSQISSLQPEMIKSITVDRNPSAKYDAKYNSVMHIITKNPSEGNFAIQLGHASAVNSRYNHSEEVNINHSKGKFTNYLSYKFKNKKEDESATSYQNIFLNGNTQNNSYFSRMDNNEKSHSFTLGSNIKLNNKNTFDIQYFYDKNKQEASVIGNEILSGSTNHKYDVTRSGKTKNDKHTVNLNYALQIDSTSSLDLYGDYAYKKSFGFENVLNKETNSQNTYDLDNNSEFDTYALRIEYDKSFSNGLILGLGTRFSEIKGNAHTLIKNINQTTIDNKSELKEQTFASYATLSKQFEKLFTEVGVRVERNKGDYVKNGSSVFEKPRVFTNVFPSLSLNYDASKKIQLNFNYNSKIVRPSFSDLDPSVSYLSSFLFEQGSPVLKPTINHNLELGTTINDKLNLGIGYNLKKDAIAYLTELDSQNNNLLIHKPINLDNISSLNFNTSYAMRLGNLNATVAGNISYPFVEYPFMGKMKKNSKVKYELVTTGVYLFSPKTMIFGTFVARSKHAYINTVYTPIYNLVLGANFKLFKDKLVMTVFGNNLLDKGYSNTTSEYGYVSGGQNLNLDKRMLGIKLKYNINSFKDKFKKSESSQEDLDRVEGF